MRIYSVFFSEFLAPEPLGGTCHVFPAWSKLSGLFWYLIFLLKGGRFIKCVPVTISSKNMRWSSWVLIFHIIKQFMARLDWSDARTLRSQKLEMSTNTHSTTVTNAINCTLHVTSNDLIHHPSIHIHPLQALVHSVLKGPAPPRGVDTTAARGPRACGNAAGNAARRCRAT